MLKNGCEQMGKSLLENRVYDKLRFEEFELCVLQNKLTGLV